MRTSLSILTIILVMLLMQLANSPAILAQGSTSLFQQAENVFSKARAAQADILSPKNFSQAMKYYKEALEKKEKRKPQYEVDKSLRASLSYLKQALEASKLAEVTFNTTLKGRSNALNADAPNYAGSTWMAAEKKFEEAARNLENGNSKKARSKSSDAHLLYKQAELEAIKANYLSETWNMLQQAKELDVKNEAPKTLQRANDLIEDAERELNTNRYDTDVARTLAQEAKYEAKHAIYLSETIKQLKKSNTSMEDILLSSEQPLKRIALTMDVVAEFDNGPDQPTAQIIEYIKTYQDSVTKLHRLLSDKNNQLAEMQKILEEQSELKEQLGLVEEMRSKFNKVENLFTTKEADVFRENDNVVIRLSGLKFPSGQSLIQPTYFGLLSKVKQAIEIYPNSDVIIEGHTDSYGPDNVNRQLSEDRAAAVKQYLLANMSINPARLVAVGYGENNPIANNKT
ncbi:MAG: OmpA family protein, partial [Calditrichia bacterium]